MDYYAGIDVSMEYSSVCVVDGAGKIVREGKVASEVGALIIWFSSLGLNLVRIGLEAGPLSHCVQDDAGEDGPPIRALTPVFAGYDDARGIAELIRQSLWYFGWFRPVHCKSMEAQETRAILTARKQMQAKLHDVEGSLRGILRGFGLKVGKTTPKTFEGRIRELVAGHPTLETVAAGMLSARAALLLAFNGFEKRVRVMARQDARARLLMTTPSVGAITALTYASAIDDPARFKSSKSVGAHFGMTPKKYQSGETDYSGRISKAGDGSVRTCLYEAAHVMLTRPVKGSALKSWATRLAKRAGMQKAKVALARKLAVIMHRMLVEGKPFNLAAQAA